MLNLRTPRGLPVAVPEAPGEDLSPKFDPANLSAAKDYYLENGYVVVAGLVAQPDCDAVRHLWDLEVKTSTKYMYRQATARAERNVLNANGWVMNPILNLQSIDPRHFSRLRTFATEKILASPTLAKGFMALLGEPPKIVQSMYFEGNSATWEHQDSYYLDSEKVGAMVAAWIALEDITASAGRFFVCPRSHRIHYEMHSLANNIAEHHETYIQSVVQKIKELNLEIRAPLLRKGDVLFWNAWTIHGSLDSQDPKNSRSSVTCHAIPRSHRFLQLQSRVLDPHGDVINGVEVTRPKDMAVARNRFVMSIESNFPGLFYWAKKLAVKAVVRKS